MKKVNPIMQWWMTPKLPYHDIFEFPLLVDRSKFGKLKHFLPHWAIHPIKRRLARWYLRVLQKFTNITVIGVTGSAGKSTTVQMIASVLRTKARTIATPPSIDPIYNVPNTILKCPPNAKFLILEMSVEYPGEMDYYLWLARPDMGLITNIFPTHTEFLINEEGVLKEKRKLTSRLRLGGIAVLNKKDERLKNLPVKHGVKVVWFDGDNANAARAVGKIFEVSKEDIEAGIKNYERPKHRLTLIKLASGATLLDDSYNANPEAVLATLRYFNKLAGKKPKIAVLGDMLELGKLEESEHRRVGSEAAKLNFEVVIGVGKAVKYLEEEARRHSTKIRTYLLSDQSQVLPVLGPLITKDTFILVKGSRSLGLDKLVDALA